MIFLSLHVLIIKTILSYENRSVIICILLSDLAKLYFSSVILTSQTTGYISERLRLKRPFFQADMKQILTSPRKA